MVFREVSISHSALYGPDSEYIWAGFMDAIIRQMQLSNSMTSTCIGDCDNNDHNNEHIDIDGDHDNKHDAGKLDIVGSNGSHRRPPMGSSEYYSKRLRSETSKPNFKDCGSQTLRI